MGAKILEGCWSHSFHPISTKIYEKHYNRGWGIYAIVLWLTIEQNG